jgi:general L-amino acid transport system substrate-binding protein
MSAAPGGFRQSAGGAVAVRRVLGGNCPVKGNSYRSRFRGLGSAVAALCLTAFALAASPASGATLDDVRARGHLICGVGDGVAGFSHVDERGVWSGLDIDFCSAVAAAVFGRKDAVKFRPLTAANSFQALRGNEIDLLSRATTWTLSRDTELGLRFAGTIFHDGQGFLVRRGQAVASVLELSGASVCVLGGTSAEQGVVDYFRTRQMRYQLVVAERWVDLVKAYVAGTCSLLSSDVSVLALERSRLAKPSDHMLLPELITKEPSGPVVREGDDQWFAIVKWTLMALIAAEELGITSENVDSLNTSTLPDIRRFLGLDANLGQTMGLERDWSYKIVKQVGNYGEIFARDVGATSTLALERGVNGLWTKGGLMYAIPLR